MDEKEKLVLTLIQQEQEKIKRSLDVTSNILLVVAIAVALVAFRVYVMSI